MPDSQLQSVLDQWKQWPIKSRPDIVHTFNSGLNHRTYLLKADKQHLVIKLFTQSATLAIDLQRWATKYQLAPQLLFSNADGSYVVMEYLSGPNLTAVAHDHPTLAAIASGLQRLHSAPLNSIAARINRLDIPSTCEHYLSTLDASFKRAHQTLLPALQLLMADDTPACLCHNDLVTENCFLVDGQLKLIDWEYAQLNNPWFDLVAIIYYLQLGEAEAQQLLNLYHTGWGGHIYQPIYNAALCTLLWLDVLWYLAKFGDGNVPNLDNKLAVIQQTAAKLNIHWSV